MEGGPDAGGLAPGSVFAGYRIEALIGRGGMAVVYRAEQLRPRRKVALKLVAPGFASEERFRARFERESEVAAQIEHPYVVPVYEVDEWEGQLYISMRYVDGPDLRALVDGPLEPDLAVALVSDVASALDAAHARGLVHRDVKPANIMVSGQGSTRHAYLTDFGLTAGADDRRLTTTGQFVGTLDYVAPEQIQGDEVDARADVYALACVLYETLTGEVPYPRDSEVAKVWAHVHEPPPSARAQVATLPAAIDAVIKRGMAKDPAERFGTAGELALAAGGALETGGAATGSITEAPPPGERTRPMPGPADPQTDGEGARPVLIAGVVAGALAIIAAVVLLAGGPEDEATVGEPRVVGDPIAVGARPSAIAAGGSSIWVANTKGRTVTRIDAATARAAGEPIEVGRLPSGVAVGKRNVWVANLGDNDVSRLNSGTGEPLGRISVGTAPYDVAVGFGGVWTADFGGNSVTRINADSNTEEGRAIEVGEGPSDVAVGEAAVWVSNSNAGTITRINPETERPAGAPIPVGATPESIAVGAGRVWTTNLRADTVTVVDAATNSVDGEPIPVGERPDDVAFGFGSVWVANQDADTVTRIDPEARVAVGDPIAVGDGPAALAIGEDAVWVANLVSETVTRIEP